MKHSLGWKDLQPTMQDYIDLGVVVDETPEKHEMLKGLVVLSLGLLASTLILFL